MPDFDLIGNTDHGYNNNSPLVSQSRRNLSPAKRNRKRKAKKPARFTKAQRRARDRHNSWKRNNRLIAQSFEKYYGGNVEVENLESKKQTNRKEKKAYLERKDRDSACRTEREATFCARNRNARTNALILRLTKTGKPTSPPRTKTVLACLRTTPTSFIGVRTMTMTLDTPSLLILAI
jgi:hypothetical protein